MPRTAKAAVLVAPRQVEMREYPIPETGDDDALLRIEACGVCASDVPTYTGLNSLSIMELPVILGHEIVGHVENLGKRAAERWGVKEGDRIIVERWIPCGHCENCYSGNYRLCIRNIDGFKLFYGGTPIGLPPSLWGGFAEYMYLHPDTVVYKVTDEVPAEQLPLFTPISNNLSWLQYSAGLQAGQTVVIQGPGQEGLASVIAAQVCGAHNIVVVGLSQDERRLALAKELGATHTLMADEVDVVAAVKDITGGAMANVVLDVTSSASASPVDTAIELAGDNATIVLAAGHAEQPAMPFPTTEALHKQLTIKMVWGRRREYIHAALRLIESGKYPLHKLTTHHLPLEQTGYALSLVSREADEEAFHVSVVMDHA
jgi:threonine dehydrogenase-like Zn-dependent dehydrogenase